MQWYEEIQQSKATSWQFTKSMRGEFSVGLFKS